MKKETIDKIKNATIVVLVLVIVFGASYFTSELQDCDNTNNTTTEDTTNNSSNDSSSTTASSTSDIPEDEQGDLNDIDIDEYLDLKEGKKASIIYIARPTCHYCQEMEPIIRNVVYEYDVEVNYLNTDELDDDGQAKLIKSDDYFSEGYGTPLLLVVKDDKIVDIQEGLTDKDATVKFLQDNGFID